jgi:hypothetical protein
MEDGGLVAVRVHQAGLVGRERARVGAQAFPGEAWPGAHAMDGHAQGLGPRADLVAVLIGIEQGEQARGVRRSGGLLAGEIA